MMSTTAGRSSKYPFTALQWQELEQQALIYKYMVAGMPIPPDLLFTVKRNLDSSISSKLFPYQTSAIGWNPYQMGFGGKRIDPEPGRCRRTDGKKWRCSKEAYPDSKYCERHMHRGKNRSRKTLEDASTPTTATVLHQTTAVPNTKINILSHQPVGYSDTMLHQGRSPGHSQNQHHGSFFDSHFLYPHTSSSRPPGNTDLASQNMDSGSFRERYLHGVKEDSVVGEHAFFTESSGTIRGFCSSSSMDEAHRAREAMSDSQSAYPFLELKTDITKQEKQTQQLHIWGRDFSSSEPSSMKMETEKDQSQTTIHHFFDEWSSKGGRDPSLWHDSSTTQLSISMPTPSYDFFLSSSSAYNEG